MKIIYDKSIRSHALHIRSVQIALASLSTRSTGHECRGFSRDLTMPYHARQGWLAHQKAANELKQVLGVKAERALCSACRLHVCPVPSPQWAPAASTLPSWCPAPARPACVPGTSPSDGRLYCCLISTRRNLREMVTSIMYTGVKDVFSLFIFFYI